MFKQKPTIDFILMIIFASFFNFFYKLYNEVLANWEIYLDQWIELILINEIKYFIMSYMLKNGFNFCFIMEGISIKYIRNTSSISFVQLKSCDTKSRRKFIKFFSLLISQINSFWLWSWIELNVFQLQNLEN